MSAQPKSILKLLVLALLVTAALVAAGLMLGTSRGRSFLQNPHAYGHSVRDWVSSHRIIAPLALLSIYVLLTVLSLPIWWVPILAGYGFGLLMGIIWAQLSFTCAAVSTASLSRFLLGDWFHKRVESHAVRLRALDERAGHNGLLVVGAIRLMHVIPAGLSNYAFGLTKISLADIAVGTFVGGLPGGALGVTFGAAPHLLKDWRYISVLVVLNIVPIAGLILRYLRPEWFKSIGIE